MHKQKNKVKNAFFYFMLNFKQDQKRKGVNYGSMAELAEAASFYWKNLPSDDKAIYTNMAKKEKEKQVSNDFQEQPMSKDDKEIQDIEHIVRSLYGSEALLQEDFYLMDVNVFCKTSNGFQYLIAESTVLRFSLKEGLKDMYHELINPGKIPVGYSYEAKLGSKEIGIELPDERQRKSNYIKILANIMNYLKKPNTDRLMPPLYTLPDKIVPITNFIQQMCSQASEDPNIFRVYHLDTLFYEIYNTIKIEGGFTRTTQALARFNETFKYFTPGMGCEVHHIADKTIECTTTRVKCWAYEILDTCCPLLQIEKKITSHYPGKGHLENMFTYDSERTKRPGVSVHEGMPAVVKKIDSSNSTSVVNASASVVTASGSETNSVNIPMEEKRRYEPIRMPKTKYTTNIAPNLDNNNPFPVRLSMGRGRGLCRILENMRIHQ